MLRTQVRRFAIFDKHEQVYTTSARAPIPSFVILAQKEWPIEIDIEKGVIVEYVD